MFTASLERGRESGMRASSAQPGVWPLDARSALECGDRRRRFSATSNEKRRLKSPHSKARLRRARSYNPRLRMPSPPALLIIDVQKAIDDASWGADRNHPDAEQTIA